MKSRFYVRPKGNALCFAVCHYAGRVVYQAEGFLEKNRNFLPPEVIQVCLFAMSSYTGRGISYLDLAACLNN